MANKKITKKQVKKAVKEYSKLSSGWKIFVALLFIIIVIGAGAYYYFAIYKKNQPQLAQGELSIHFLELGNHYTGDCVYIKAGENDIIVDGGSRTSSVDTIKNYVNQYVTDGKLEYVIITHNHQDHIAAWAGDNSHGSLFDFYDVSTIIDFPLTKNQNATYSKYLQKRDNEVDNGAKHYTALECYNNENGAKRTYSLSDGINLQILYNYYYDHTTNNENNFSVCFMINQGSNHYLFTGDLESEGEEWLVKNNTLPKATLFKAGHHGSANANSDVLLNKIQPQYIAITCVAGDDEYAQTFPYQATIDRIAPYTDNVFVTSCREMEWSEEDNKWKSTSPCVPLNGTIIFTCTDGEISFTGTNNSVKFKDSDWFNTYRTTPAAWA